MGAKDYSDVQPKSYQSTFQTWVRGYSSSVKDVPIAQYLEENMGTCEYLRLYLECLTTAKGVGAYRKEVRWFYPKTELQYDNVVSLCRQNLIGPFAPDTGE